MNWINKTDGAVFCLLAYSASVTSAPHLNTGNSFAVTQHAKIKTINLLYPGVINKVKTSTIGRLHLCIGTTCEINLVRPAVLAVVGLLSLSSFHCQIPLKIKTEWQAVSQIFTSAVLMATSTGCDRL